MALPTLTFVSAILMAIHNQFRPSYVSAFSFPLLRILYYRANLINLGPILYFSSLVCMTVLCYLMSNSAVNTFHMELILMFSVSQFALETLFRMVASWCSIISFGTTH